MAELLAKVGAPIARDVSMAADAPSLAPSEPAIDRAHLALMTAGERDLEREVLTLFATQADILLGRMRGAVPAQTGALAHTLCGSARGIGAWKVAEAAAALEAAAAAGRDCTMAMDRLAAAGHEAQLEIADLLRA
jgi:hypothetical protein